MKRKKEEGMVESISKKVKWRKGKIMEDGTKGNEINEWGDWRYLMDRKLGTRERGGRERNEREKCGMGKNTFHC